MQNLSELFLNKRRQSQYIDPKSIDNDPLDQQILACARSLASMAADNQFHEEAACIELQRRIQWGIGYKIFAELRKYVL